MITLKKFLQSKARELNCKIYLHHLDKLPKDKVSPHTRFWFLLDKKILGFDFKQSPSFQDLEKTSHIQSYISRYISLDIVSLFPKNHTDKVIFIEAADPFLLLEQALYFHKIQKGIVFFHLSKLKQDQFDLALEAADSKTTYFIEDLNLINQKQKNQIKKFITSINKASSPTLIIGQAPHLCMNF